MMCRSGKSSLALRISSRPLIPGISISVIRISKWEAWRRSSASCPECAFPQTVIPGADFSMEKQGNGAERAVNGAYKRNPDDTSQPFTGWEAAETGTQSLVLDLEFAVSFDRYVIKHDNSTSGLGKERNTDSFKVQVLEEGVT